MSRTDKTRPFRVKLADQPQNYKEIHNHAWRFKRDAKGKHVMVPSGQVFRGHEIMRRVQVPFTACDLPLDPANDRNGWDQCHYAATHEFANSGEYKCGCPTCADKPGRQIETKKRRRIGKFLTRNWDKDY